MEGVIYLCLGVGAVVVGCTVFLLRRYLIDGTIPFFSTPSESSTPLRSTSPPRICAKKLSLQVGSCGLQGPRPSMEDTHCIQLDLISTLSQSSSSSSQKSHSSQEHSNDSNQNNQNNTQSGSKEKRVSLVSIFDGHGGTECSAYCAEKLPLYLRQMHSSSPSAEQVDLFENPQEGLRRVLQRLEDEFLDLASQRGLQAGSTAVVSLLLQNTPLPLQHQLLVACIGDSEAILYEKDKRSRTGARVLVMTTLHNPAKNAQERDRVQSEGGRLFQNRIGHPALNPAYFSIAVSRAIGDTMYKLEEYTLNKKSGLSAVPDFQVCNLSPDDSFLLIGCDGLWDVFGYEEAADFIRQGLEDEKELDELCQDLCHAALLKGSNDNVSVILVVFDWSD